ncbi:MAG: EAL domain-containing protein, partial [Pseudomonadota bacterium]
IARLSINLSGKTFGRPRFLTFIQNLFEETGIEPSKICFEITETAAISNLARCTDFLRELRYLGCRFSLDDFGTGLSSFSYLKHLPVDYLKIDGSFIRDISSSAADYGLVKTINEIGHFLGKETVAEFVENEEVLNHLREIGLDFAQGFGIERPRPLQEILKL